MIDAHCHLVRHDLSDPGAGPLLEEMDGSGVTRAWCLGLPFDLERYDPPRYSSASDDAVLRASRASGGRLLPFACGFDPRDPSAPDYLATRITQGFVGVGELLLRYDGDLGRVLRQPVDDPRLLAIYRLAGEAGIPVLFHATVRHTDEIDRALASSPDTVFVWAHCGVSWELGHDTSPMVRLALERHRHLFADISWILWDLQLWDRRAGRVVPTWARLFADHPDRFLVGFDLVGDFHETAAMAARYRALLEQLPDRAREPLASGNAERLIPPRADPSPRFP